MAILNCLWIGALAGLVAGRLIRGRNGAPPVASTLAVGVLGALLGGRADTWIAHEASFTHGDMIAAAIGAGVALTAWAVAHRSFLAARVEKESG